VVKTLEATNPLALDLARALDPVTLANQIGLEPEPWQELVLRSRYPRVLLNCHRQAGKSTIAGLLAVHVALYQPGSLILLLSPAQMKTPCHQGVFVVSEEHQSWPVELRIPQKSRNSM